MEIIAEPGMVSYGSCDISNQVKGETAAPGLRSKIRMGVRCVAYRSNWFASAA